MPEPSRPPQHLAAAGPRRRWPGGSATGRRWVGGLLGLAVLSAIYCLPEHPSAGRVVVLDIAAHACLFLGLGLWFGALDPRRWRALAALALVAALLEALQWRLGGYARLEWLDVASNEAGLALAWLALARLRG